MYLSIQSFEGLIERNTTTQHNTIRQVDNAIANVHCPRTVALRTFTSQKRNEPFKLRRPSMSFIILGTAFNVWDVLGRHRAKFELMCLFGLPNVFLRCLVFAARIMWETIIL
jgi:hypothetical protein